MLLTDTENRMYHTSLGINKKIVLMYSTVPIKKNVVNIILGLKNIRPQVP